MRASRARSSCSSGSARRRAHDGRVTMTGSMADGSRPGRPFREAVIDLDALRDNLRTIAAQVAPAQVMAVVKADAYGHGALPIARAALDAGVSWLGTADLDEAMALRAAGIEAPVLAWLHDPEAAFEAAVAHDVDLGVSSAAQLRAMGACARVAGRPASVHLKIDTGLSRNGVAP